MALQRTELAVLLVTLAYIAAFGVAFVAAGNIEFIGYIATLLIFVALIASTRRAAHLPARILWALSLWGFLHMAGGGVMFDGEVLYAVRVLPLAGDGGELTLLKYDQIIHFYGFGVTALMLYHLLRRNFPELNGTRTAFAFATLGSMGLGALNEMIEFAAVLSLPDTNVGGYYNIALDLVFNAAGAICAAAFARQLLPARDTD